MPIRLFPLKRFTPNDFDYEDFLMFRKVGGLVQEESVRLATRDVPLGPCAASLTNASRPSRSSFTRLHHVGVTAAAERCYGCR
jgi:hypothetical protein